MVSKRVMAQALASRPEPEIENASGEGHVNYASKRYKTYSKLQPAASGPLRCYNFCWSAFYDLDQGLKPKTRLERVHTLNWLDRLNQVEDSISPDP